MNWITDKDPNKQLDQDLTSYETARDKYKKAVRSYEQSMRQYKVSLKYMVLVAVCFVLVVACFTLGEITDNYLFRVLAFAFIVLEIVFGLLQQIHPRRIK